jgi:hypothetical protein
MNIIEEIAKCDERLKILREGWMDSKDEKKQSWVMRLDAELDERSKLMKQRDGKPQ